MPAAASPVAADVLSNEDAVPAEMLLEETPLCPTIAKYVYPKKGVTREETAKFIINSPDTEFIQVRRCNWEFIVA